MAERDTTLTRKQEDFLKLLAANVPYPSTKNLTQILGSHRNLESY